MIHTLFRWLILLYRRFVRQHLKRVCIYQISCSEFALRALDERRSIIDTVARIKYRVGGCTICSVEVARSGAWHLVNGHGEKVLPDDASPAAVEQYGGLPDTCFPDPPTAKLVLADEAPRGSNIGPVP